MNRGSNGNFLFQNVYKFSHINEGTRLKSIKIRHLRLQEGKGDCEKVNNEKLNFGLNSVCY